MTDAPLVFLPLPALSALLCAVLAGMMLRLDPGRRESAWFFAALFAVFAFASALVGLRFGYGVEAFVPAQRILPLFFGPLMYLGFAALAVPPGTLRRTAYPHLGAVVGVVVGFQLIPPGLATLDWAIGASYAVYAIALLRLWRQGPDALVHARLGLADGLARWMPWGAGLLVTLLVLDTAIAVSFLADRSDRAASIISVGSGLIILFLIAVLVALPRLPARPRATVADAPGDDDARLEAAAREMLTGTRLFLDPDLSVQRLARRLHVPERDLSAAINRSRGMNVSQYVNGFRLAHAADLLRTGDGSVAEVMAASGFLTRSNFYREFGRVYGCSPAAWRRAASDGGRATPD